MQKKTIPTTTYSLRSIADYVSDYKVVIGAVIVVVSTIASVVMSYLNYYLFAKNAPIVKRIEAVERRDQSIEQALVDNKADHTKIEQGIIRVEDKIDRLMVRLIK